ncbi:MAG: hypothetical protein RTU92_13935 [Candidatus Thorarchaeota archaeon]
MLVVMFVLFVTIVLIAMGLEGKDRFSASERITADTAAERLYRSKVEGPTFFDGESEYYTEAMSRVKTMGGG